MTQPPNSSWVLYRSVAYLVGRGIHFGAAQQNIFNRPARQIGKFCVGVHPAKEAVGDVCDDKLEVFADQAFNYVFVSRAIEAIDEPKRLLGEAADKLKPGGHLVVHLPINAEGETIVHRFDPISTQGLVASVGSWQAKGLYERDGQLLQIYKKLGPKRGIMLDPHPTPANRVCVVRYGAFGDMIVVTPVLRELHKQGYNVTVNCASYSQSILDNNPYVDNRVVQESDAIPNHKLGEYWKEWEADYGRYINLSESIEGKLLAVEGRPEYYSPKDYRVKRGNKNYYDFTLGLAGLGGLVDRPHGELFFSPDEQKFAQSFLRQYKGRFIGMWGLNGSSFHKMYGLMEPVLTDWLASHPDAVFLTVGDYPAKLLEFEHPQIVCLAGQWPIRKALALIPHINVVIGPETAVLNAAGCFDTPKITLLSHSTHEALCRHWTNDYCLAPNPDVAPCYPCFQLHYTRRSCPQADIVAPDQKVLATGPVCAMGAISGEAVINRLNEVYLKHYK